jgi:hypothetical protein
MSGRNDCDVSAFDGGRPALTELQAATSWRI